MRSAICAALILLLPATLLGIPSIGLYFSFNPTNPGQAHYGPMPGEAFFAFVYVHNWDCYLTAVEFAISPLPPAIIYSGFDLPEDYLNLGDPQSGIAITWFPPVNDPPPYHLVCTINLFSMGTCIYFGGSMVDFPIAIIPNPDGGGGIYATCWPEQNMIELIGETSIICPDLIANEEHSWGAIKDLFE